MGPGPAYSNSICKEKTSGKELLGSNKFLKSTGEFFLESSLEKSSIDG